MASAAVAFVRALLIEGKVHSLQAHVKGTHGSQLTKNTYGHTVRYAILLYFQERDLNQWVSLSSMA